MDNRLSLTELQLTIRDVLYTSLPGVFWVSAEISEIKENNAGHCYLELVDKIEGEVNIKARARAVIWANRYRMLKPFFENTTGESLKQGLKVLIKVTLEYHEIYGLSLVITDIDPAFTIGEMALRRLQIIRRLEEDGVIDMNKEHPFPYVPGRIAIISSKNAAGYTDFVKQLHGNIYGYAFYTALFEAAMQGNETSGSVINALDRISEKTELFDVVVIIRGGGSQTDLSWFDNYDIAYHITQFPLPVITGIGHDKDMTVADIVANISAKTPTAVADLLINRMVETESLLIKFANNITSFSVEIIDKYRIKLTDYSRNLIPLAKNSVSEIKDNLSNIKIKLLTAGKDKIQKTITIPQYQNSRLESYTKASLKANDLFLANLIMNTTINSKTFLRQMQEKLEASGLILNIIDPVNVLKRGFTITSLNGRVLKSCKTIETNSVIDTQFIDGVVKSKVVEKKNL